MSATAPVSVLQLRSSAGLYGADRMVLALDRALQRGGVRSRLLSVNNYRMREQALYEAAQARGQRAALLPCRGRFDPRTVGAIAAEIRASEIRVGEATVLHAHDYKSAFYAWLATRGRSVPLVATLHGWVEGSRALRLYHRLELALLRRFDALVVVAAEQAERLARAGVAPARIHQIDNGIESGGIERSGIENSASDADASTSPGEALSFAHARFVFGAVARLAPEKNLALLLEAFAPLAAADPGVALLIVGDGPERAALEAQAAGLGLQACVRFAGERRDMARIYPLVDCLVLPSLTEGMPLAVLEAMAHAIPIVASSVGELPRLLQHCTYGRLVPPGDLASLRSALQVAQGRGATRDARARAHVLDHHSPDAMAGRYLELYRSVARKAHGR